MNLPKTIARWLLGSRSPHLDGNLRVAGLHGPIAIRRDAWGIPMISASCDDDAWFGLGFVHAQDRGGQLELIARIVRGTLSSAVGADALPMDRLSRRIGFHHAAGPQLAAAAPEFRAQVEAYCRGVNAGIDEGQRRPPHELAIMKGGQTRWEPADVQAFLQLLCFALASNWDIELARLAILERDGEQALQDLDPVYPEWLCVSTPPGTKSGEAVNHLAEDIALFRAVIGVGGGSNAWVVSADKTASGRPLLANDPHMLPSAPSQFYMAHLATPQWRVVGGTFAGIPCVGGGHNGHGAWGVTAAHADNTDLFIEEIGPDGRSVRVGEEFVPCPVRQENIEVKGRKPEVLEVLETPRGPIVGPVFAGQRQSISMSATWLAARPYHGFLGMHKVRSPEDVQALFSAGSTSSVALVYAFAPNTIGWQMAVEIPVRKKGYGMIPLPGSDPEVGWEPDPVPFDDMPRALDPPEGFLATSNNRPWLDDETTPWLGADWLDGYRHARICEVLSERDDWDVPGMQALHMDVVSIPWREMGPAVLAVDCQEALAQQAQAILKDWDGQMTADSIGATVYAVWFATMVDSVITARAPNAREWALGKGYTDLLPHNLLFTRRASHLSRLICEQPDGWFEGGWSSAMEVALATAVKRIQVHAGTSPDRWAWGEVRPTWLQHPFGEQWPMDRLFHIGPIPAGGDASTVHQSAVDLANPLTPALCSPTARMVVDVGAWENSRYVVLGGQSGNPYSPHHADMVPKWLEGDGVPLPWTDEDVQAATVATLQLDPV